MAGAQPGDVLKVQIKEIKVSSQGVMATGENEGTLGAHMKGLFSKIIPIRDNYAIFDSQVSIPLKPMIGVIGVAPRDGEVNCGTPGSLPGFLSKVHDKFQTPYIATISMAIISIIITVLFSSKIAALTSLVNFGALTSFMVLNLSVIIHYVIKSKSRDYFRHLLLPILGFMVIFYVWINLDAASKTLGVWWLGIGVVYYLFLIFVLKHKPTDLDI